MYINHWKWGGSFVSNFFFPKTLLYFDILTGAAVATYSHTKTPAPIISKYLQYGYWPWIICLEILWGFFFNKIQDGRQILSHSRAWTASWICYMFSLKERPYPERVLISFWCYSDNKNFFMFIDFWRIFQVCSFWLSSKLSNITKHACSNYFKIFAECILALGNLPGNYFFLISAYSTKSKIAAKILYHSLDFQRLHKLVSCLVQSKDHTLGVCW